MLRALPFFAGLLRYDFCSLDEASHHTCAILEVHSFFVTQIGFKSVSGICRLELTGECCSACL
jgi:hypothetical protein